ncbi:MAG: hypothetical protein K8S13_08400 [Desulfobacula sp.]|nr:hypothetical protein [Desulfobacula sp.]MCD4719868.1 hypothetical protein [Desulfobacula sp.]
MKNIQTIVTGVNAATIKVTDVSCENLMDSNFADYYIEPDKDYAEAITKF